MTVDRILFRSPTPGNSSDTPSIVEGKIQVGGQDTLLIADMTSRDLLEGILIELRKINLRQCDAFEIEVNDEDI